MQTVPKDVFQAITGFNQVEISPTGEIISRPVKPAAFQLGGARAVRQNITSYSKFIELLAVHPVRLLWMYDGIALAADFQPQEQPEKCKVIVRKDRDLLELGVFDVTLKEDFSVPREILQTLEVRANTFTV